MKNNLLSKTIAATALLLGLFTNSAAKAQLTIANPSSCDYVINWSMFDNTTIPCITCDSGTTSIPPGTNVPITISSTCLSTCDFIITVTAVGGVAPAIPITVSINGPASLTIPAGGTCPAPHVISINPAGATIN